MKKALSIAGSIITWLIVILSLFFGLSVLGKRLWITTQFGTIFYFMVLPFLILFLVVAIIAHIVVILKQKKRDKKMMIRLGSIILVFLLLFCETAYFKSVVKDAGGKYSLLEGLTLKNQKMSQPDEQVVYANREGQDLTISIYKPKTETNNLRPVYVYMHGGGWCSNNAETNSNMHRQMADEGYICFSINYRLCTPSSYDNPTWDKAIYDCADAMNWIKDHAEEYGGDSEHIILVGESAGGNLVLHYSGMVSENKLDAPIPQAVLAMYPVVDLQWTADNAHYMTVNTVPDICEAYIGGNLEEYPDRVKAVSPLTYMNTNIPPTLIIHGKKDTLVSIEGSEQYKKEADDVGADVTLVELPFTNHGTEQQVNRTVLLNWLQGYDGLSLQ